MKPALAIVLLSLLGLSAGLGLAWWWYGDTDQPAQTLPNVTLPDMQGQPRSLAEWQGQVLVLNFWATWCKPCREEVPMLVSVQADYAGQGLQIVGLAIDEREPVQRFAGEYGINYPLLVDANGVVKFQDALNGGAGLPYTVIVGRDGRVHKRVSGALTRAELERIIEPIIAQKR